ncbi:glycosyltransferase family 1 protein [Bacillaceae bacterium S4-13-56]
MRIAIFTDTYKPQVNGVSMTLQRFANYLERRNFEYQLFVPEAKEDDLYSSQIHRFTSMPFLFYPECRFTFPNFYQIKKELKQFNPDLIHIATPFNIGLSGLYYGSKLKIPIVGSYHTHFNRYLDYYNLQLMSNVIWKYMRWFHQPFLKTFVPSHETKRELLQHGFNNIGIWSRGVDCEKFKPDYTTEALREKHGIKEKFILTYVGRLAPEKDLDILMKVAHQLTPEIKKHIHWLIVGDGPMKEKLELEATDNMTFTGYLKGKELAQTYAGSTLFVFPSTTETFGNVVLESLASGTPAICAKSGGVQEIVTDQKTGLLCRPRNIEDFRIAISKLIENEALVQQMSYEARNFALSRSWDDIFDDLVAQYEEVLLDDQQIISYA